MTTRFLVLAWRHGDVRDRADAISASFTASGFVRLLERDGLIILAHPDLAYSREGDNGFVLGRRFVRSECDLGNDASGPARAQALTSFGWGNYIAILDGRDGRFAMADPSGAGRGHMISDERLTMVADFLTPTMIASAGYRSTVDLRRLSACLVDPASAPFAPLLSGIRTLVPGRLVNLAPPHDATTIWSPAALVPNGDGDGRGLVSAVDEAVRAFAGRRTLIELSGGLDSSIVLGTMAECALDARAVAIVTSAGDVEEIEYAADAARLANVPLHISRVTAFPEFRRILDAVPTVHPFMYGTDDVFAKAVATARERSGSDVVLTGQGGDAVFFQPATFYTAIDRFRSLGLRSGIGPLLDDARRARTSIWSHMIPALRDRFRPVGLPSDNLSSNLLTESALRSLERSVHPWVEDARSGPPGRLLQITMMANSQNSHSARPTDLGAPLLHPLLSQPVIEAALALPSWVLASGSIDRGCARRVFADRIPKSIARRPSKGEAAAYYSRTTVANLPFLRSHLLDGALASAGIIDVDAMNATLNEDHLFYSLDYRALSMHAKCEAWLRSWQSA
ncbi:asparagine synthase C-terminal domain-containing protein [Sphingomonas faeni]|uniref:asparagine synthase C-terminal domain-containing protein n=1 Tax=Sphingomonas faeni TaxID=185950 RepID=UPI00336142B0